MIIIMKKSIFSKSASARLIAIICLFAIIALSLLSCSEKVGDYTVNTKTVAKIKDYKITYDEYRSFYLSSMASLENGDGTIWYGEDAPLDELKKLTEDSLRRKYAIKYLADKYGIKLTKEDKANINAYVQECINEYGGMPGYRQWLTSGGMTGRIFRENYELVYFYDVYLREILFTGIDGLIKVDDETIKKDIEENFYHYTWIYIPFEANDNYLVNAEEAQKAYEALEGGEDFYKVAEKYSDWTGNTKTGIYAIIGEKVQLIEDTALSLKEGEYSKVLAFGEGHAILMRLPMDDSYINSHFDEFVYQSASKQYSELIEKTASEFKVKYTAYYDELTMDKLKSNKGYITEE